MPDEDNNFGGSLVLDIGKWWRRVQPKNCTKWRKMTYLASHEMVSHAYRPCEYFDVIKQKLLQMSIKVMRRM